MEEKVTTDGEGLRALGIVLFVISSLGMIVVVFFFQNVTALQIMLALWIISGIMYFSPYFIPTDYHRVNFDYFGTKIHNAFAGEWHSKVIDMPEYLCIEYSTVGRSNYERYTYQKRLSSNTIGVYEGTKSANDFFDVYYYGFNSEEDRISRQKAILQTFKDKEGSIKHYSSENVLIVFRCFSIGSHMSSAYPYIKWLVTRNAVKNVELESSEMRKSLDTKLRTSRGNGKSDDL